MKFLVPKKHTISLVKNFHILIYSLHFYISFSFLHNSLYIYSLPYLKSLYKDPSQSDNLAFYLTSAYTYPGIPILLFMIWKGHRFPVGPRILISLVLQAAIMLTMPILSKYNIWIPLSLMFMNGLCTMVLQSSLFGLASHFPPIYNQAIMGGQGWAGVIACASQIIVLASSASSSDDNSSSNTTAAIAYFVFAALVMIGCAVSYIFLLRIPYSRTIMNEVENHRLAQNNHTNTNEQETENNTMNETTTTDNDNPEFSPLLTNESSNHNHHISIFGVFKQIWPMATTIFTVFLMTFIIFPAVMDQIPYKGDLGAALNFQALAVNHESWWLTILLTTFNVADTIGRMLPAKLICMNEKTLLPLTLLRFALIPLFLGCINSWSNAFNDATAILILFVFSITNGYNASLAFMFAPSKVDNHEKQTAGFIMSFLLNAGIVIGSQIALAFAK